MPFQFKLDISSIKEQLGQVLDHSGQLNLPDYQGVNFQDDWEAHAKISHTYNGYYVAGEAKGSFRADCDRCLEPYTGVLEVKFNDHFVSKPNSSSTIAPDSPEEEETHYFSGDEIDLTDVVWDAIKLALPMKRLCSQQCKGLCPQCGTNFNNQTCNCQQDSIDPRLAKLADLLTPQANDDKGGGSNGQPKK